MLVDKLVEDAFRVFVFAQSEQRAGHQLFEVVTFVAPGAHHPFVSLFTLVVVDVEVGTVAHEVFVFVGVDVLAVFAQIFVSLVDVATGYLDFSHQIVVVWVVVVLYLIGIEFSLCNLAH